MAVGRRHEHDWILLGIRQRLLLQQALRLHADILAVLLPVQVWEGYSNEQRPKPRGSSFPEDLKNSAPADDQRFFRETSINAPVEDLEAPGIAEAHLNGHV